MVMSRNRVITAAVTLLALSVASFAAINMVVGQRYTLTGKMAKCPHHADTYFLDVPHGPHAMAGSAGSDHADRVLLKPATPTVNLKLIYNSLAANQKIEATGIYTGITDMGHGNEKHQTIKVEKVVLKPVGRQEANFATLHDLRRQ
jgi:hypothetical protein